ncbi:hypothetical protein [Acetonema longum]|uniref:hypothetical protein n=1 Tax=Acetonema longum TaxID=2374 RepID=UPI00058DB17B|nr:hypothetical protein [Acetonema longum]
MNKKSTLIRIICGILAVYLLVLSLNGNSGSEKRFSWITMVKANSAESIKTRPVEGNQMKDTAAEEKMVGFWQDLPFVAARYGDNYLFFADKTFRFKYNEAYDTRRLIGFSGRWEITNDQLILQVTQLTIVVGGTLEKSPTSASGYAIVNGDMHTVTIDPPEKIVLQLSEYLVDNSSPRPITRKIGGEQFWRLTHNPALYK